MPVSEAYMPDPRFSDLGPEFADIVAPAHFPQRIMRFRNQRWAARVGLGDLDAGEWEAAFARFEPLPRNLPAPLAIRYHGHQFRVYNPEIGDGRGFLFAQLRDDAGRLLDLGTKGSGRTPYSRFGDGRLTLKGGVREALATEMLEALGVYTSKTFSLFETGEALQRSDEPSPTRSAVLVRLSHSHVRFGAFQRLAYFERADLIEQLIEYVIAHYHPGAGAASGVSARAAALLAAIVEATADLCARWMAAGFVHGVLNTDNMNVTGESFDYGPWRFLPVSAPGFTAAYFDHSGLYAFGRQPEAVAWNLGQLAGCFALVAETEPLEAALRGFAPAYRRALRDRTFARLGLAPGGDLDVDLQALQTLFAWMTETEISWPQFFHDWFGGEASAARALAGPEAARYEAAAFAPVRSALSVREAVRPQRLDHPMFARGTAFRLDIEAVEAIWAPIAQSDDWSGFDAALSEIAALREALDLDAGPPPRGSHQPVMGDG